jgi:hypothetical protein
LAAINSAARLTFKASLLALINSAARFSFVRFEKQVRYWQVTILPHVAASRRFQNKQRIHFL